MTIRLSIADLLAMGQLPDEHNSAYDEIKGAEDLLNQVENEKPVTDEEAAALVTFLAQTAVSGWLGLFYISLRQPQALVLTNIWHPLTTIGFKCCETDENLLRALLRRADDRHQENQRV